MKKILILISLETTDEYLETTDFKELQADINSGELTSKKAADENITSCEVEMEITNDV